jgi:hypothetical protein
MLSEFGRQRILKEGDKDGSVAIGSMATDDVAMIALSEAASRANGLPGRQGFTYSRDLVFGSTKGGGSDGPGIARGENGSICLPDPGPNAEYGEIGNDGRSARESEPLARTPQPGNREVAPIKFFALLQPDRGANLRPFMSDATSLRSTVLRDVESTR